jgi:integrase
VATTPDKLKAAYSTWLADYLAAGCRDPRPVPRSESDNSAGYTVEELIADYWQHAVSYYRDADGELTQEHVSIREATKYVRRMFAASPAAEFGPKRLKAVRAEMARKGIVRTNINRHVARIKGMFRWAVENELLAATNHAALQAVKGLRAGRQAEGVPVAESDPVKPVPEADIAATIDAAGRIVAAMIAVQSSTGMRSGELVKMTSGEIDTTGTVWTYSPRKHKTAHRGKTRTIYLDKQCQAILGPMMTGKGDTDAIFSPREAEAERRAEAAKKRKTPINQGNRRGYSARTRAGGAKQANAPGRNYTTTSYRRAVARAAAKAGVRHWHPHQVRHTAAWAFCQRHGLDVARTLVGHADTKMTRMYAANQTAEHEAAIAALSD